MRIVSFHAVSTAAAGLFGGFDRCRRAAGGSFVDDDLTQVLDAVFGEGGHPILTHPVDPEAVVFGNMSIDREDGCDRRHDHAASRCVPTAAASSTAVAGRYCGRVTA